MIKLLMLDVDGVLTDGGIIWSEDGIEQKRFHVRDGMGIKICQRLGITVAVITGRPSEVTSIRCRELGIEHLFMGGNKVEHYKQLKAMLGITDAEAAFMGDDLIDLHLLQTVGFSATVADAEQYIKDEVHFISPHKGGYGAVRTFIDEILRRNGQWEEAVSLYY